MINHVQETGLPSTAARVPVVSLMGASFDTGNLGVSALASGTIAAIRAGFPDARLSLLDYGRPPLAWIEDGASARVQQVNLRFSKRVWLPNNIARLLFLACLIRLVPVRAWRRRLVRRSVWLRRLAEPDFHLALSGGDSFSEIYGMRRLVYMALPQLLVLLLEKPLILLPQTYGPFRTRPARVFAGWILRQASAIYSRDRESVAVVNGLLRGRGRRPRLAYDMGFGLEPRPPAPEVSAHLRRLKQNGPLVGFNVSGLLSLWGNGGGNPFNLKSDYADLVAMLLDLFADGWRAQVLLIPHVYGEAENSECDRAACREVVRRLGHRHAGCVHLLEGAFDHHETKHIIGECEFFLGSRMHACIGAVSQCVPAVGLAYSRKFAGVMDLVGDGAVVADLRTMTLAEIASLVDGAWRRREAMRGQLRARMPEVGQSMLGLFRRPEFQAFLKPAHP